jgi:hypothetical protein
MMRERMRPVMIEDSILNGTFQTRASTTLTSHATATKNAAEKSRSITSYGMTPKVESSAAEPRSASR